MWKKTLIAAAATATLVLGGCSGDDEPKADATPTPTELETPQEHRTQAEDEPWELSAREAMTEEQVNYLAICVQWDGFQDGVPWVASIENNAILSGNDLALDAVRAVNADVEENGEAGEEATELMERVCADVER